jgi:Holliday junction resolvase
MREKTVETKIKDYLFQKGIYHFKVHGSKFMPAGIPDIVCCFNGSFLGIEVKRPGAKNEQSAQQKVHERNIVKSGGTYLLVDSLEEVVDYVESKTSKQDN